MVVMLSMTHTSSHKIGIYYLNNRNIVMVMVQKSHFLYIQVRLCHGM